MKDPNPRLKCIYGNKVQLLNLRTNQTSEFELVHYNVEKLGENKISNYTPIGKAIWAKEEGAEVVIDVPNLGRDTYRIVHIQNA
jgi:transcription elongation GreA/GreB family factor